MTLKKYYTKTHQEIGSINEYGENHPFRRPSSYYGGRPRGGKLFQYDDYSEFVRNNPDEFIVVGDRTLLSPYVPSYVQEWLQRAGSTSATLQREYRCSGPKGLKATNGVGKRSLSKLIPDPSGLGFSGENGYPFSILPANTRSKRN